VARRKAQREQRDAHQGHKPFQHYLPQNLDPLELHLDGSSFCCCSNQALRMLFWIT
jgi:hypothetical protein